MSSGLTWAAVGALAVLGILLWIYARQRDSARSDAHTARQEAEQSEFERRVEVARRAAHEDADEAEEAESEARGRGERTGLGNDRMRD